MKFRNSQIWIELSETQSEQINGGAILFNYSFLSKLTTQENGAITISSGNAIGIFNAAGVAIVQTNIVR